MISRKIRLEAPLTQALMDRAGAARIPISGTFELTPVCNFACKMCYVRKTPQEVRQHDRPMVTCEQWLEIAKQARDAGLLYLLLTGGEPFVWPDFWKLYGELSQMGFLISINSNGSLIDDTVIARLKKMPPVRVNITLYGASDETYEALCGVKNVFSRIDRAINGLLEAGLKVKLNCSLTPHNAKDLDAIVRYAQERNLILQVSTYMFPPVRRDPTMVGVNDRFTPRETAYYQLRQFYCHNGDEVYRRYLEKIQEGLVHPPGLDESCIDPVDGKIRCRAGNASFWITWDGWMIPCGMMPGPKAELHGRPFMDAWQDTVAASERMTLSSVCQQCPNQQMCHACAAIAMAETGDPSGIPKHLCQMVQKMKEIAAYQLATGNYAGP